VAADPSSLGGAAYRSNGGRAYPAKRTNAEEAPAARIAAISGESEETLETHEGAILNAIPRQEFEIEISTTRAMRKAQERPCDTAGVEALVACVAAPWA
jgi:hypothetical protein